MLRDQRYPSQPNFRSNAVVTTTFYHSRQLTYLLTHCICPRTLYFFSFIYLPEFCYNTCRADVLESKKKKQRNTTSSAYLELELMRELALLEAEGGGKILAEMGNVGNGSEESLVDVLLVGSLGLREDLLLLLTLKELFFGTLLVADSLLGEVIIVELFVDLRREMKV